MKNLLLLITLLLSTFLSAQQEQAVEQEMTEEEIEAAIAEIEASLVYFRDTTIELGDGVATLSVPAGFKYLDAEQSDYVLTQLWGNPSQPTLGMLFKEEAAVLGDDSWAFDISYEEMGYVEDDEAASIDYDELADDIRESNKESNTERVELGYDPVTFVGWAERPYYDEANNKLHWAKELKFGDMEENTLNYEIRALGRKGVLVLNGIATANQLNEIKENAPNVINSVAFNSGYSYAEFNPEIDKIAAVGIGGLIAGKVLAKAGFFALLLKFWKVILIALAGAGAVVKRFFFGDKEEN